MRKLITQRSYYFDYHTWKSSVLYPCRTRSSYEQLERSEKTCEQLLVLSDVKGRRYAWDVRVSRWICETPKIWPIILLRSVEHLFRLSWESRRPWGCGNLTRNSTLCIIAGNDKACRVLNVRLLDSIWLLILEKFWLLVTCQVCRQSIVAISEKRRRRSSIIGLWRVTLAASRAVGRVCRRYAIRRTERYEIRWNPCTDSLVKTLNSVDYADETRSKIKDDRTSNDPKHYGVFLVPDDSGTSHVSVLAPDGSAVSVTSTINQVYVCARPLVSTFLWARFTFL